MPPGGTEIPLAKYLLQWLSVMLFCGACSVYSIRNQVKGVENQVNYAENQVKYVENNDIIDDFAWLYRHSGSQTKETTDKKQVPPVQS